jgi:hypothetical protein
VSLYGVQRAVFDAVRRASGGECACPPGDGDQLTAEELSLLERQDLRGLFTQGVHPVLVNAYARATGRTRDEYRVLLAGTLADEDREVRWRQ